MKTISNAIAILLMLGLLLGLGWGGYITTKFLISQFGIMDPKTSAILTISSVTFLLSAIIIAASIKSSKNSSDKSNHPRKLELYTQLVEALEDHDEGKNKSVRELKNHLIIWASDSVLEAYGNYLDLVSDIDPNPSDIKEQAQKVITAIRQDVREENTKIDSSNIAKLLTK